MDHFGIGAAMQSLMFSYKVSSRHTGRTTSLVDSLKDGDRVIFLSQREAIRVQRLCKERGIEIATQVYHPKETAILASKSLPRDGRTIFDHSWVEEFYSIAIHSAAQDIDRLQTELSGHSEAHRKTERAALEIAKYKL